MYSILEMFMLRYLWNILMVSAEQAIRYIGIEIIRLEWMKLLKQRMRLNW